MTSAVPWRGVSLGVSRRSAWRGVSLGELFVDGLDVVVSLRIGKGSRLHQERSEADEDLSVQNLETSLELVAGVDGVHGIIVGANLFAPSSFPGQWANEFAPTRFAWIRAGANEFTPTARWRPIEDSLRCAEPGRRGAGCR